MLLYLLEKYKALCYRYPTESDKEIKVPVFMKHFMRSLKLSVADYKRNRAKPNCICGRLTIS